MTFRRGIAAAGAILVIVGVVAWRIDWGPFAAPLDDNEQAVVDEVEAGVSTDAAELVRYVDTNLDLLLSDDVADAVDDDALAGLFETALTEDSSLDVELFEHLVAEVAGDARISSARLKQVFANASAARIDWFDQRVNEPFAHGFSELSAELRDDYFDAHDFLRETMGDPTAAAILQEAVDDYGRAQTAAAPADGTQRTKRLIELGRLHAFFSTARTNAEGGEAIDSATEQRFTAEVADRAVWVALDRYEHDSRVRESARGLPFVNADGRIDPDLTADEAEALQDWANSLALPGGLTFDDFNSLAGGSSDIQSTGRALDLEDRY